MLKLVKKSEHVCTQVFKKGKPKTLTRVGVIETIKTMKKSLKSLKLRKEVITNFDLERAKGGATELMCNSVPRWLGGLGCHLK